MSYATYFVAAIAALFVVIPSLLQPKLPENFGGTVDSKFKVVENAFRQNFRDGWEREGAAIAVYHKGKLVVDLWGGYADAMSLRKWNKDTITVAYSSTKALAALCVAKLVNDKRLDYDKLVTDYWPEFGKHGKGNVTVQMLIEHRAGLASLDEPIEIETVSKWRRISSIFEHQTPNWPPGKHAGYHAVTFGWLIDQLIRRVDVKHRSVGQYFKEEIQSVAGGSDEFYIGLPTTALHRITRQSDAGAWDTLGHMLIHWQMAVGVLYMYTFGTPKPLMMQVFNKPEWALANGRNGFNNPDVLMVEVPASNGVGTARGLALPFVAALKGKIIDRKLLTKLSNPTHVDMVDYVLDFVCSQGYGFGHTRVPGTNDRWLFGHPGYGGQNVKVDVEKDLVFAYVTNSVKFGAGDLARTFRRLQDAIYVSLK